MSQLNAFNSKVDEVKIIYIANPYMFLLSTQNSMAYLPEERYAEYILQASRTIQAALKMGVENSILDDFTPLNNMI